ncbi:MAG: carbamoyltransferase HypF [Bacteroidota bacterium]
MITWHIHIEGQVQGIGFRPFVYLLAQQYQLKGWVNNTTDGVHIEFSAMESLAEMFYKDVIGNAPQLARITNHYISEVEPQTFTSFDIIQSEATGDTKLLITPDFAICNNCKTELLNSTNRRYLYAFITCTQCGPRYSIIDNLPYDRHNTTMHTFTQCPTCQSEYDEPTDRRYFSQTNSCMDCGISMQLFNNQKEITPTTQQSIIDEIINHWQKGKIIAIKGIGGYLLTCSANDSQAIARLRARKNRPSKPLALMIPKIDSFSNALSEMVIDSISDHSSPIVLISKNKVPYSIAHEDIAPDLEKVGLMLPYTPLYVLLMEKYQAPIVATSGNPSGSPIIFDDEQALESLTSIADLIVINNRKIVVPQDDSVLQYSDHYKQKIILRRSRGLAPTYINPKLRVPPTPVLAMGAMLKSTFCLTLKGNVYVSQYLGNLNDFETQESYKHSLKHFLKLFKTQARYILCDKHPAYPSTQYAHELADILDVPILPIQHHKAHFGAILGENNLIHSEEKILGVIWDGTGLGDNDQIWGGEFFTYNNYRITHAGQLKPFQHILGDKMSKEPRISAFTIAHELEDARPILQAKFSTFEWKNYRKMMEKSKLHNSSMGRLFDAVSSILLGNDVQFYEGEAAIALEIKAQKHFKKTGLAFDDAYPFSNAQEKDIYPKIIIQHLIKDILNNQATPLIAAKFHNTLVNIIQFQAEFFQVHHLAFSGGVFQNSLLVDLIIHRLSSKHRLYFHQQLSPNDECISFGQLMCHHIDNTYYSLKNKSENYVLSNSR